VSYWLINLRPDAQAFFNYLGLLYLDLIAAESLVIMISSIFPIFVVALALTAFANGLWMTVGGFLVSPTVLNAFWKYTFHQIDYQRFTFEALVRNQMIGSNYTCGTDCHCEFVTSLAGNCLIDGSEAVEQLGYTTSTAVSYVCFLWFVCLMSGYVTGDCAGDESSCWCRFVSQKEVGWLESPVFLVVVVFICKFIHFISLLERAKYLSRQRLSTLPAFSFKRFQLGIEHISFE